MCGRFENTIDNSELIAEFEKQIGELNIAYDLPEDVFFTQNIAPTDVIKVVTFDKTENVFKLKAMRWGVKSQIKAGGKLIDKPVFNSRIETCSKPGKWSNALQDNRCIVPMTAFYEWTGEKGKRKPQRISVDNQKVFFGAGIITKGSDNIEASSIITCEPNRAMTPIHDRMPVLLDFNNAGAYLQGAKDQSQALCTPLDDIIEMKIEDANLVKNPPPKIKL